jgi:hypothetical protein
MQSMVVEVAAEDVMPVRNSAFRPVPADTEKRATAMMRRAVLAPGVLS